MKKLTLTAEAEVIDLAKRLAATRGTSVSAMFGQLIRAMAQRPVQSSQDIGPLTRSATGLAHAPRGKTDRQLLEDALLERYGT